MKKILLGATVALALSACSTPKGANEPLELWHNFEKANLSAEKLGENQSLLVFFRQGDISGPETNIYINGDYHASLSPNALTPVAVCAADTLLSTSFTTNKEFGNRTNGVRYNLPAGEIVYIKMAQDAKGKLNFARINEAEAKQAIAQLPQQAHTISRVWNTNGCGLAVLANATLDAGALFAFNKAGYNDILPQGKKEIAEFAEKIPTLGTVEKIVVSGHTDPVGSASYNQALSQKRAETVKATLQKAGVTSPIEAVGYGKAKPVVTHCENLKGKEKQACNQPNRRVEITVYGNK